MARYEDKFMVPLSSLPEIDNFFDLDSINFKNQYPSRFVNSIYYDTEDYFFARQNSDGNGLRTKIRLRFYNHDSRNSMLEVKNKYFSVGNKLVQPFFLGDQVPDRLAICNALKECSEVQFNPYHEISPKLFVRYKRKYWTSRSSQGVRITLDSTILAKEIVKPVPIYSLFDHLIKFDDLCVLEIKYDSQEDIRNFREFFHHNLNLRRSRFSKYVLGLMFTSQVRMD